MIFNRVVVGITHSVRQSKISLFAIRLAVLLAGGKPMMISSRKNTNNVNYDCLILYGGVDIDPHQYNLQRKPNYQYDYRRDEIEEKHFHHAMKKQLPILGICRGAQMINILLGGNLYQDIRKLDEKAKYPHHIIGFLLYRKMIFIDKHSRISKILKRHSTKVNSIHSQAIDKLGQDLYITAREKNKIIQVIEHQSHPFLLGVQFHPEFMLYKKQFRNIFKALTKKARNNLLDQSNKM